MTGTTTKCICRTTLPLKVCQSHAGYYLGYTCPNCGPYDRVSGYYDDQADAHNALAKLTNQGDTDGDITAAATQEVFVVLIYPPGPHELTGVELFTDVDKARDHIETWKHHSTKGKAQWCFNEYIDDDRVLAEIRGRHIS